MATTVDDNVVCAIESSSASALQLRRWWMPPVVLLLAGLLAVPFDHAIAERVQSTHCPGALRDYLQFAEMFGHGLGVLLIAIVVGILDPDRRRSLPRLMTMA